MLQEDIKIHCRTLLIKSLEGNWLRYQLFCLGMARSKYLELEAHLYDIGKESECVVKLLESDNVVAKKVKTRFSKKQTTLI